MVLKGIPHGYSPILDILAGVCALDPSRGVIAMPGLGLRYGSEGWALGGRLPGGAALPGLLPAAGSALAGRLLPIDLAGEPERDTASDLGGEPARDAASDVETDENTGSGSGPHSQASSTRGTGVSSRSARSSFRSSMSGSLGRLRGGCTNWGTSMGLGALKTGRSSCRHHQSQQQSGRSR